MEEYERLAKERIDAEDEEKDPGRKEPPVRRELLKPREYKVFYVKYMRGDSCYILLYSLTADLDRKVISFCGFLSLNILTFLDFALLYGCKATWI